jgi:hypothetical protein
LYGIAGGRGEARFADGNEFSPGEPTRGCLGRAFGYPNRLRELLIADGDCFSLALLLCGEPQVHEKTHRPAIVSDQVAHQDVDYVIIHGEHRYTNGQYSTDYLIAPLDDEGYVANEKNFGMEEKE